MSLTAFGLLLARWWSLRRYVLLPSLGLGTLLAFVLTRAASFHHVDELIGRQVLGVKMNVILELGGIVVIGWGAHRYIALTQAKKSDPAPISDG